jgi:EpsI family protein
LPVTGRLTIALTLIFAGQIIASYALVLSEQAPGTPALQSLPARIGEWAMIEEQVLEPEVAQYLQPDDYIMREYLSADTPLNLFVAYFKSLKDSYGPHSPRVCLPGAGWSIRSRATDSIAVPGRAEPIPVNQYVMERNREQILVLYWYQNERRIWANEFEAKLHLLPDLLRHRRSEVSLVRIVAPFTERAVNKTKEFAGGMFPLLAERLATID